MLAAVAGCSEEPVAATAQDRDRRERFGAYERDGRESSGEPAIGIDGLPTVLTAADSPLTVAVRFLRTLAEPARMDGDPAIVRKLAAAITALTADDGRWWSISAGGELHQHELRLHRGFTGQTATVFNKTE